jgi:hypothetical protein
MLAVFVTGPNVMAHRTTTSEDQSPVLSLDDSVAVSCSGSHRSSLCKMAMVADGANFGRDRGVECEPTAE